MSASVICSEICLLIVAFQEHLLIEYMISGEWLNTHLVIYFTDCTEVCSSCLLHAKPFATLAWPLNNKCISRIAIQAVEST